MHAAGTRLGPYEIVGPLGTGGMGEVYRARDTKLDRDVAIKILPELFAADPERLKRFEREAKTLASLNHPNIAQVFGVIELPAEAGGYGALVMEMVDGDDLAIRLKRGGMPLDEAVPVARQIADALEAAHERGIVHRDLKPANVKVRDDGTVKVLDFGLAKAIDSPEGGDYDLTNSPTITSPATLAGVILGTAAYMAPEQAKGKVVDKRADIWALGCVLYEALTGHRAFAGSDVSETLAQILTKDPDWRLLPPKTPDAIRQLLRRCLQKDPRQRLRDIGDARLVLQEPLDDTAARTSAMGWQPPALVILSLAVALAAIMGAFDEILPWRQTPADARAVHFSVAPPPGKDFTLSSPASAISPDGSRLVLVVGQRDSYLAVRPIDGIEMKKLPGTEGGMRPFFSPDGRWIAFTAQHKLKRVALDGGTPLVICDADWGGGVWTRDDTIIYTPNYASGLWRISVAGGTPVKLTDPDTAKGELGHFWPQVLPDGQHVVFTGFSTPVERSRIAVYSLQSREQRTLVQGGMHAWYVPTGHLVYAGTNSILVTPFDANRLSLNGAAITALDDVFIHPSNGLAQLAVSPSGTIAFIRRSDARFQDELVWIDRKGSAQPAIPDRRAYEDLSLSPDGQRLAITILDANRDLWIYDFARKTLSPFTSWAAADYGGVWSPDGRRIAFVSERPVYQVFQKSISGTAPEEPIVAGSYDTEPTSFSPDGKVLVYTQSTHQNGTDILMMSIEGDRKPKPILNSTSNEDHGIVSPDGRWLAFQSDESGRFETYVQPFPTGQERWQVSNEGGRFPRWRKDTAELFYLSNQGIMGVGYRVSGNEFVPATPTLILSGKYFEFDVAPDGQRFIVNRPDPNARPIDVHVVVNWFGELRKRMATGR
jgi:serine/threonine-protein kinase